MSKFYLYFFLTSAAFFLFPFVSESQCSLLDATCTTYESRCAATGAIKIHVTGGSGNYKYKTTGPVNTNFTTLDSITGLSAGLYSVVINDLGTNCSITKTNVRVDGTYQDPRFTLAKTDVSCDNANNGSILVNSYSFGRAPFDYTIIAPSPMGIGSTSTTGVFSNLGAGNYSIRMSDSCGGIQTRQITINGYSWWIDSYSFIKTGCDEATGWIKVVDSKGNISTVSGIPGFSYAVVRSAGDTIWSGNPNFVFALLGHNSFKVLAKDACGIIKIASTTVSLVPQVTAAVNTYNYSCNFFAASLQAGANFLGPSYCLYNSNDIQVSCNISGVFDNIPYGTWCIKVHDACTDTTIIRCFTVNAAPVSLSGTVTISNKVCSSFSAAVTGQSGLTNPSYCLYDSAGTLITCNSTGVFNGLSYQPYCIITHDGCRDTSITRCFNVEPPVPVVPLQITPYYITCSNFGVHVPGDSLTAPQYCLYDSNAVLISCNNNGTFDSIPLGTYCIHIHDACYDTTFVRCLAVLVPIVHDDISLNAGHRTCQGFTLTASSNNIVNPLYCLYADSTVFVSCNTSGVFTNIPFGSYCIKTHSLCPDTTFTSCIAVYPDKPEVGQNVLLTGLNCATFNAGITSQQNLSNPVYCLYDSTGALLYCNSTGQFGNLLYGSYCIRVTDGCYDTTIDRCFLAIPVKVSLSGTAGKSCSYGWAQFNLNMGNGTGYLPVNISIFNPDGSLFTTANYSSNAVSIDSIPAAATGELYKVVATDQCGNKDSVFIGSPASLFTHSPSVVAKCPGAVWANGSGDIRITVHSNMGSPAVKIIKKNGVSLFPPLAASTVVAGVYTFSDLGPGTYISSASESFCNKKQYDTIIISNYQYPNLDRSSAYQCDVNGFSISAVASNGVAPFSYEIIGSQPLSPSIISGPQSNPVFTINNGSNYSLIRLRALDACGNATLGDASILPLAINAVISTEDCLSQPTTLSVDSFYNSTYTWYKKPDQYSPDSVLIGTGTSYSIPAVLPSDTGFYICHVTVNSGCINRTFNFHLGGQCWIILPLNLVKFEGQVIQGKNKLSWRIDQTSNTGTFIIERKTTGGKFTQIGVVHSDAQGNNQRYSFYDNEPPSAINMYRIGVIKRGEEVSYSQVIALDNRKPASSFAIYPNPAMNNFSITHSSDSEQHLTVRLFNILNQFITELPLEESGPHVFEVKRPTGLKKGIYILNIYNSRTKEIFNEKIIFL